MGLIKGFILFLMSTSAVLAAGVGNEAGNHVGGAQKSGAAHNIGSANYVGVDSCKGCHQQEYQDWQGSHHEQSMMHANANSVKANFNNATETFNGQQYRFFKKGDQFWVSIPESDGTQQDYQVKYTFGVEPLQQYLVEFDDGRIQAIPHSWDSRPKSVGGQRWFYLHTEHSEQHQDFYWKNQGQNWNFMCADCHSTGVEKNFDLTSNTYNTTFKEVNVACEACHGPGSDHLQWAQQPKANAELTHKGFDRSLATAVQYWQPVEGKNTLFPKDVEHTDQLNTCAQCHSRHVQITDTDSVHVENFGDRYQLNLIDDMYHADGQVKEENYVFGSFLQSKMAKNHVVCTNCHNPHSAKLKLPVESLCLQCHSPESYATPSHHRHQQTSEGAQCVNCHMPETTYMEVDPRRDHRWHIPRPDQSEYLDTSNACTQCHDDKGNKWANDALNKWGVKPAPVHEEKPFAMAFAPQAVAANMSNALSHISQDINHPEIIRASALERLSQYADGNALVAAARGVKHDNEYIRLGSARGAENLPAAERWRIVSPLLKDDVLAVRMEAVDTLMPLWQQLNAEQKKVLEQPVEEYIATQAFNADRGFAHVNIGNMHAHRADFKKAAVAYQEAIRIEPIFDMGHVYLAEMYRLQGDEEQSKKALLKGEQHNPDNGVFAHHLGLAAIRVKDYPVAIKHFRGAVQLSPHDPQYFFVLGLALENTSPSESVQNLYRAYDVSRNPEYLYATCEMSLRYQLDFAKACIDELAPQVPDSVIQQLLQNVSLKP